MGEWALIINLALRNFWRQRRRNLLLLLAVTIGMTATLAGSFIIRGWQNSSLEEGVERLGGNIVITHPEWNKKPEPAHSVLLDSATTTALADSGLPWISRVLAQGTLQSERETRGTIVFGIDPDIERRQTAVQRLEIDGDFLSANPQGIVIGAALAHDLETELGKRIVLIAQDSAGNRAEAGLRIVGIYHSTSKNAERATAYMHKARVQELLQLPDAVTEIVVATPELLDTQASVEQLTAALPELAVQDWRKAEPTIWALYQLVEGMVGVWQFIFLGALAFGLVNTLVAAVLERTREFGLLLAVGMRPASVLKQVLIESWLILFSGLALGGLCSIVVYYLMKPGIDLSQLAAGMDVPGMMRPLYPSVVASDLYTLVGIILLFGFFASIYPARRAVALNPVAALNRH